MSTVEIETNTIQMNPALSESIVFAPNKTENDIVPIIPINAALSESIVFTIPQSSQQTTTATTTAESPNVMDGATNNKKSQDKEQIKDIEIEEDKEHSVKRKDNGSLGDVVDNEEKVIPNSLDSDAPEEVSSKENVLKSEINIKQVLKNPSFDATNDTTNHNNTNNNRINNDTDEITPPSTPHKTTTTTTTTTTTSSHPLQHNNDNVVSFNESSERLENSEDFKASGILDSPNRVRLNTSQRLKMMKQKSEKRLSHRPKSIKLEHKKNVLGEIIYKGHPSWALMLNIQTGIRNAVGKSMGTEAGTGQKTPQQYHTLRKPSEFKRKEDFYASPKTQRFDSEGSAMTNAHSTGPFKFKDYCPNAFRYLRYLFGIDTADFMVSLCNTLKNGENALRELPTPGKSGSLFFFSHDMKFIIKTIPKDEAKLLRDILPAYLEHIETNPNSLLPRFFGLYRVKPQSGRQVRFVIMGNLFPTKKKIHERFDLKGSVVGREASTDEKKSDSVTFKDIDFRNRKQKIYLGVGKKQSFIDQIKRDCKLLQSLNIMDYSLLIGIHYPHRDEPPSPSLLRSTLEDSSDFESPSMDPRNNNNSNSIGGGVGSSSTGGANNKSTGGAGSKREKHYSFDAESYISAFQQDEGGIKSNGNDVNGVPVEEHYFLGVIDILMLYSIRKKFEHTYKTLKFGSKVEISSVSPDEYSERFQNFLETVIE